MCTPECTTPRAKTPRVHVIYARCCCDGCCVYWWAYKLPSKSSSPIVPKGTATQKAPARHRARGETPARSFALGTRREGKERVKGKASRIKSSRIGSGLACVRRNAQSRELKLLESTRFVLSTVVMVAVATDGPACCLVSPPPRSP